MKKRYRIYWAGMVTMPTALIYAAPITAQDIVDLHQYRRLLFNHYYGGLS